MKQASRKKSDKTRRPKKCPYCAELIGVGKVHICPVGCCSIVTGPVSHEATCPYCDKTFEIGVGHVCLDLLKLTEPAQ